MSTLFISDLHLDASRPEVTECFLNFLKQAADRADALYILGDLFEVWIGDDDPDPHHQEVIQALREFTTARRPCYFMRGNRDVLIGRRFCAEASAQLLDETTLIDLYGDRVLLLHGDELCTDDQAYQKFRRQARSPTWRAIWLSLPLGLRRWLSVKIRNGSKTMTALKPEDITDVNQDAVEDVIRGHRVKYLVHGHTHRPGTHQLTVDGRPATRIVLGDWYEHGSILEWGPDGPQLHELPQGK
jgi:UDP-2,3-diacylglucosamine hydrolase